MNRGTCWAGAWEDQEMLQPTFRLYRAFITKAATGFDPLRQARWLLAKPCQLSSLCYLPMGNLSLLPHRAPGHQAIPGRQLGPHLAVQAGGRMDSGVRQPGLESQLPLLTLRPYSRGYQCHAGAGP